MNNKQIKHEMERIWAAGVGTLKRSVAIQLNKPLSHQQMLNSGTVIHSIKCEIVSKLPQVLHLCLVQQFLLRVECGGRNKKAWLMFSMQKHRKCDLDREQISVQFPDD